MFSISSSSAVLRRILLSTTAPASSRSNRILLFSSTSVQTLHPPPPTTITHDSVLYVLKKLEHHPDKALAFFNHASANLSFKPNSTIYILLLRSLAHKDFIKHFWSVAKRMEEDGCSIDGGSYFSILVSLKKQKLFSDATQLTQFVSRKKGGGEESKFPAIVNAIVGVDDWGDEIEKFGLVLSDLTVDKVLRELKHRPSKALEFFRWAEGRNPSDYKHGASSYNLMLRVLGMKDSADEFWVLLKEMQLQGIEVDIDTYIKIMRRFKKNKMLEDAVTLYEHMMDSPYKPAIHDCGLLLRQISLSDPPDLELVSRVVSKYEANGHTKSKIVYDGILRSLTKHGSFEEASEVIEKMKSQCFEPDNITYSQLVFGLCKSNRLDEARKVLDNMELSGCLPDVKTWTVLIQGHFSIGEVDSALSCLTNMVSKNCEPDGELLDITIKGLCKANRVIDAHVLFLKMGECSRNNTLKPRQATFKYLIEKLLDGRRLEEALELLILMKKHKLPPFADLFPPYISKFGTVEDAMDFLRCLNSKDSPSPPAYLILFEAFFKEGRFSEAQDLLYKSPHHILFDTKAYSSASKFSSPRSSSQMNIYSYAATMSGCKNRFAYHLQTNKQEFEFLNNLNVCKN